MSRLFASGDPSIGASASAPVLPMYMYSGFTEKPGMLQFMGSQRGGHDLVTEQQQVIIFTSIGYRFLPEDKFKCE